jgi:hypothetical protein
VLAVAGCGGSKGPPKLDHADAAPLVALAHRIAREGSCGQARDIPQLQRQVIALVNTGRVADGLREPLTSAANALAELAPRCLPTIGPVRTDPPAVVVTTEVRPVPHASSPSQEARNLEGWLRSYSRETTGS